MLKSRVWVFWVLSFVIFLISALLVSILSFLGVYYYQSLDYYFHEGHLGTLYPVALLAISSLSCFLLHLRETTSLAFVFKHPLSQKNTWFWCGFAFAYLSLDDLFEIHEKIDFKLHHWLDALAKIKSKNKRSVLKFVNSLKLFGYGFSWGGFESLALYQTHQALGKRQFTYIKKDEHIIRMHIGLEDPIDIINDIKKALKYIK